MNIFDFKNGKITLTSEAMAYPHINKLHKEVKNDSLFFKYIQYIVFSTKWDSGYKSFSEEERDGKIKKDVFGDSSYKIPKNVVECMEEHRKFSNTPSTRLLEAAESGVEYLIKEYNSLKDKQGKNDNNGKPLVPANDVYKWLNQIGGAVKNLEILRGIVVFFIYWFNFQCIFLSTHINNI